MKTPFQLSLVECTVMLTSFISEMRVRPGQVMVDISPTIFIWACQRVHAETYQQVCLGPQRWRHVKSQLTLDALCQRELMNFPIDINFGLAGDGLGGGPWSRAPGTRINKKKSNRSWQKSQLIPDSSCRLSTLFQTLIYWIASWFCRASFCSSTHFPTSKEPHLRQITWKNEKMEISPKSSSHQCPMVMLSPGR